MEIYERSPSRLQGITQFERTALITVQTGTVAEGEAGPDETIRGIAEGVLASEALVHIEQRDAGRELRAADRAIGNLRR